MKVALLSMMAVGMLVVGACSSKQNVTVEPTPTTTAPAEPNYVGEAKTRIDNLEARLENLRKETHATKYGSRKPNLKGVVNAQYKSLQKAKTQLKDLETASPEEVASKKTALDNTLTSIESALDSISAE